MKKEKIMGIRKTKIFEKVYPRSILRFKAMHPLMFFKNVYEKNCLNMLDKMEKMY